MSGYRGGGGLRAGSSFGHSGFRSGSNFRYGNRFGGYGRGFYRYDL